MATVNVIVSGLPFGLRSRCLQLRRAHLSATDVALAVRRITALPQDAFLLLANGRIARDHHVLAAPADDCVFLEFRLRRALPGGKGGFGAMLRGLNASKKTTNLDACRDLSGRRIRDILRSQQVPSAAEDAQPSHQHADLREDTLAAAGASSSVFRSNNDGSEDDEMQATSRDAASTETPLPPPAIHVVETLEDDMRHTSEQVADAVAEGLRLALAARGRRRKQNSSASSSLKRKRDPCTSHAIDTPNAQLETAPQIPSQSSTLHHVSSVHHGPVPKKRRSVALCVSALDTPTMTNNISRGREPPSSASLSPASLV